MLKGKWRKLHFLDVSNLSLIPHILISACVFHNYVIEVEGEEWPEDEVENDNGEDEIEEEGEATT